MLNSRNIRRWFVVVCLLTLSVLTLPLSSPALAQEATPAQSETETKSDVKTDSKSDRPAEKKRQAKMQQEQKRFEGLSDARKKELLLFVREHHPQLEKLLDRLRSKRPRLFQKAVSALDRDVTRLQAIEQRSAERHALALEEWKIKSRIEVLSAQLAFKDSEEKRVAVRTMMGQLLDLNIQQREFERNQLANRLETVDKRIAEMKSNRETTIDRRIKAIEKKTKDLVRSSSMKASKATGSTESTSQETESVERND